MSRGPFLDLGFAVRHPLRLLGSEMKAHSPISPAVSFALVEHGVDPHLPSPSS